METKFCDFCGEEINTEAIKCRYCGKFLNTTHNRQKIYQGDNAGINPQEGFIKNWRGEVVLKPRGFNWKAFFFGFFYYTGYQKYNVLGWFIFITTVYYLFGMSAIRTQSLEAGMLFTSIYSIVILIFHITLGVTANRSLPVKRVEFKFLGVFVASIIWFVFESIYYIVFGRHILSFWLEVIENINY